MNEIFPICLPPGIDALYRAGKTGMVKLAVLVVVNEWRL